MNDPSLHPPLEPLLSIGQFAERSRLSLKALRLYDSIGLLLPAYVDCQSGYRYYTEAQLRTAKLIGLLRHLEMPLKTIAVLVQAPEREAIDLLSDYWQEVEAQMAQQRRVVQYIRDYIQGETVMTFELQVRETLQQQVISLKKEVYVPDLTNFICSAFTTLQHHLEQEQSATATGIPFVMYHGVVNEDSNGPVEVCVPFTGRVTTDGSIQVSQRSAGQEVFTRITRAQCQFPEILKAYDALSAWIDQQGHNRAAPPREIYFNNAEQVAPDDLFCDIAWQFAKA